MRLKRKFLTAIIAVLLIFTVNTANKTANANESCLYVAGITAGFTVKTEGASVIGLSDIVTENGVISPAKNAEIKIGDIITRIGNLKIQDANSVAKALSTCEGNPVEITVVRNGEEIKKYLTPHLDKDGKYKLGVFLRDDLNGIGTITYFNEDGSFGALGHPILSENGDLLNLTCGDAYICSIIGVVKGERGKAGELKGVFVDDEKIGCINSNKASGIYGTVDKNYNFKEYPKMEIESAKMGKASILTCIDGVTPCEYSISIVKVDDQNRENKNFVIKITDKELLSKTNGILQGMSGSPIIQDGKIVGAVTHVFINDPTRGFGISIYKMLSNGN